MILDETYTLSNGVRIPRLGLGTWFIPDEKAAQAVRDAVTLGYRLIDTAQAYGNENGVGEGIRTCGIQREDIFITTKLAAEIKDKDSAMKAIDRSLSTMGLDYIDMMLIHAPQPWPEFRSERNYDKENAEVWSAMEQAYSAGKLRAIGVSNFTVDDLTYLLDNCTIRPMANQILCHISNTPDALIDWCKKRDILVESYSPIGHGEIMKNAEVGAIAQRYGVSIPQLCIRYCLQLGTVALPKTSNPEHMQINADVDFTISDPDMDVLKSIHRIEHYGEASIFPVFGGSKGEDGKYKAGKPHLPISS